MVIEEPKKTLMQLYDDLVYFEIKLSFLRQSLQTALEPLVESDGVDQDFCRGLCEFLLQLEGEVKPIMDEIESNDFAHSIRKGR